MEPGIHPTKVNDLTEEDLPFLYGAGGVIRGLQEQISVLRLYPTTIKLEEELQKAENILCIGVGRGKLLVDLLQSYPHLDIRAISREDFLYSAADLQNGIEDPNVAYGTLLTFDADDAQRIAQRMREGHTVADVTEGLPFENQSFDMVLVGVAVTEYIHHKTQFISEVKRVLNSHGIGILEMVGMHVLDDNQTEPSEESIVQFFASLGEDYTYIPRFSNHALLLIRNRYPEQNNLGLTLESGRYDDFIGTHALDYIEVYRRSQPGDANKPGPVYTYGTW